MRTRFKDRTDAGRELAGRLSPLAGEDTIVLALPRGGLPVAYEIAHKLRAPLDVINVRKLGVPWHEELALGAIATGGVRVLNNDVIMAAGVTAEDLDNVSPRTATSRAFSLDQRGSRRSQWLASERQ